MNKYLYSYLFIIGTLLFASCENELPFSRGSQEPQLLMNAMLEAGKTDNEVSLKIMYEDEAIQVGNGSVTVYVNGEKKEIAEAKLIWWRSDGSDSLKLCVLKTVFQPGDRIRLEATAENGKYNASAEVEIPQPVTEDIQVDTLLTQLKVGYVVQPCMRYRITLNDRPGEKNYYRLIIQEDEYWGDPDAGWEYEPYENRPDIINQEDVVLTDGHLTTADDEEFGILDMTIQNKMNIFTDSRFQNSPYTLKVYTYYKDYHYFAEENHIVVKANIRIQSITKTDYRYLRALNCLSSDNYNATLMEPVILPCNVRGGLGFVGASAEKHVKLRIVDRPPLRPKRNTGM